MAVASPSANALTCSARHRRVEGGYARPDLAPIRADLADVRRP